jgi:hypothetical protein
MDLFEAKVVSVSAGGSGGEDRFTVNITLAFQSMSYKGEYSLSYFYCYLYFLSL